MEILNVVLTAVVSGIVSWIVSSAVSGRTERGKQAFAARGKIREVVHPILSAVKDYQSGENLSLRRSGNEHEQSDFVFGVHVRVAADDLSRTRLFLVRRRLAIILGKSYASGLEYGSNRSFSKEEAETRFARYAGVTQLSKNPAELPEGLLARALESPPYSPEVKQLLKQLQKLERSV